MILTLAIVAGLMAGLGWARLQSHPFQPPTLQHRWLVFAGFLPQFLLLYLPHRSRTLPDFWVAIFLTTSQLLLMIFAWLNRGLPGMKVMLIGSALNFTVMAVNGGFMPISPQTAGRLVTQDQLKMIPLHSRFGIKDVLLASQDTRLEWLADRFLPPAWSAYQVAFSLGDIFLALGLFWLLAKQDRRLNQINTQRITT